MQVIIFKKEDNSFSILIPTIEALQFATIEQIAVKDVPPKCPYWIVDDSLLPNNIPVEAIFIDETETPPHGYGGDSNEFPPEILQKISGVSE
ncbi:MAG: hypothetical protein JHC33_03730 [Ignisphaera sp.]|nr:hypothetical protein [Ignisphaera sp.]